MHGNRAFLLALVYLKLSYWEFNLNTVVVIEVKLFEVKLFQTMIRRPVNAPVATKKGKNMKTVDGVGVKFMVKIG